MAATKYTTAYRPKDTMYVQGTGPFNNQSGKLHNNSILMKKCTHTICGWL